MTRMLLNTGKRWLRRHSLWHGKGNEKFTFLLDTLTTGRHDENEVPSVGCLCISPRYFSYLWTLHSILLSEVTLCKRNLENLLSRFSKLLLHGKTGGTWKHKPKTKIHCIITVMFFLRLLYDLASFNRSLRHHLAPVEWQVTYFMTKQRVTVDNTTLIPKYLHASVCGFLTQKHFC